MTVPAGSTSRFCAATGDRAKTDIAAPMAARERKCLVGFIVLPPERTWVLHTFLFSKGVPFLFPTNAATGAGPHFPPDGACVCRGGCVTRWSSLAGYAVPRIPHRVLHALPR